MASADPALTVTFFEHDLQAPWLPGAAPAPETVDGRVDREAVPAGENSLVGQVDVPAWEDGSEAGRLHPENRDIDVLVLPGLMAHEEVEGMAAGNPPGQRRLRGGEASKDL